MNAGLWVVLRSEFALWFYPICLFLSAEPRAEAKFEEHHDPEVPEGGGRECYQCSGQTTAGGGCLWRQRELMQLQGLKPSPQKASLDIQPTDISSVCWVYVLIQDKVGWGAGPEPCNWQNCMVWSLNCMTSSTGEMISELLPVNWSCQVTLTAASTFPVQSFGEIADIFH